MLANNVNQALIDGYDGRWATGDMTWELGNEKNFGKLMSMSADSNSFFKRFPSYPASASTTGKHCQTT